MYLSLDFYYSYSCNMLIELFLTGRILYIYFGWNGIAFESFGDEWKFEDKLVCMANI